MKKLGKNYYIICASMFFIGLAFYCLISTLPLFLKEKLNANDTSIGFTMGIFAIGSLMSRPITGHLLDRYQRSRVALISLGGMILITIGYSIPSSILGFAALRIVHGVFWGAISTSLYTIISDIIPQNTRGMGFGIFGSMLILAMSTAPPMAVNGYDKFSFPVVVTVAVVFTALSLIILFFADKDKNDFGNAPADFDIKEFTKGFLNPQVFLIGVPLLIVSFVFTGVISFILIYAKAADVKNPANFFTLYAVSTVIIRPLQGRLHDTCGPKLTIVPAIIAGIIGFWLLGTKINAVSYMLSAVLFGCSTGVLFICPQAMAMDIVSRGNRGKANAQLSLIFDIGSFLGGIILGYIAKNFNYSTVYHSSSFLFLCLFFYASIFLLPKYQDWKGAYDAPVY